MTLISRVAWGARYSNGEPDVVLPMKWAENWLHHSVTGYVSENASFAEECAIMRTIEAIGEANFGQGMSYTALVFPSGRPYEGHSVNRRGAHTYQRNDKSRAVCLVGNYETYEPTDAMKNGAASVIREWAAEGFCHDWFDGGHRDVYPTACPGKNAYDSIGEINYAVRKGGVVDLTPEESRKLTEVHSVLSAVGLITPDDKNAGDLFVEQWNTFRDFTSFTKSAEIPNGKPFGRGLAELYNGIAAAYAANGKEFGQTIADIEQKVKDQGGVLDQIRAALVRLEGGGTEG